MKMNKILLGTLAGTMLLAGSCTEDQLTVLPEGSMLTDDQYNDALGKNPEQAGAGLVGMYGQFTAYGDGSGAQPSHDQFGFAAFMLFSDVWGQDMVQAAQGYGYIWGDQNYTSRVYEGRNAEYVWDIFYRIIGKANDVIRAISEENAEQDASARYALSQARAVRGFCYLHLVQMYQFTDNYATQRSLVSVPIVDENTDRVQAANNPLATVGDLYDKIIFPDLEYAAKNLEGFDRGADKYRVDQQVAQGFLARAYLLTGNWAGAAEMAAAAYAGLSPMSAEQYIDPVTGFNEISNPAWLWGSDLTPSSDVVSSGIVNFPSHICALAYGYNTAGGAYQGISASLYAEIGENDIRKQAFIGPEGDAVVYKLPAYTNIKYKPYQGIRNNAVNASDIPMMRVEEMILIEAEAKVRGGDVQGGLKLMVDFVKDFRDPDYAFTSASAEEVLDEIWLQRRIEFWGEGLSWFDLKRLGKGIVRNYEGSNFNTTLAYNIPAGAPQFLLAYPRREILNNVAIGDSYNQDGRTDKPAL